MNIRRIGPGDGALLREVRLRALKTDPDAFGASYEDDASHGDDHWEERATGAASEVTLWVVDGNRPALALYEEAGFVPTGEKQPLPSNPSLIESLMVLSLG